MQTLCTHSYRCYYHHRSDAPSETGALPSIRLRASDAETAMHCAHAVLGHPIDHVERVEPLTAECA
jgi:hypothetical protein